MVFGFRNILARIGGMFGLAGKEHPEQHSEAKRARAVPRGASIPKKKRGTTFPRAGGARKRPAPHKGVAAPAKPKKAAAGRPVLSLKDRAVRAAATRAKVVLTKQTEVARRLSSRGIFKTADHMNPAAK